MSEISGINVHIEELRKRVIRSIISILVITVFILTFHATPVRGNGNYIVLPISRTAKQYCSTVHKCNERRA